MARKGFAERLLETGTRLVTQAAEAVLKDPRGQDAVARAVGAAQRGRKKLEEAQTRFMKAAGVPGRQDYQDLAKQLARIKRKARELSHRLDEAGRPGDGPDGPTTH
ncbi:hypothetical protein [Anaeromyxobacter terrae]|uniref:hypothetical protein n=1 Tax=Anaeromyxobacter terrae TaxID=2925406 RepID=UPI001F57C10E|nr:hypothetical protein [Anaeromyxobacter sp. SG22]